MGNSFQVANFSITGIAAIQSINPVTDGSIFGGTVLTINGNGFDSIENSQVKIGAKNCTIQSITLSKIICVTPSQDAVGNYTVSVTSNNFIFPQTYFTYNQLATPNVSNIMPTAGVSGTLVTVNGNGFGNSNGNYI